MHTKNFLISKEPGQQLHTGMDVDAGAYLRFKITWNKPPMALDSGFPRQSLTGGGSAGMTTFLVLTEAILPISKNFLLIKF